jgi:hypothetical protein
VTVQRETSVNWKWNPPLPSVECHSNMRAMRNVPGKPQMLRSCLGGSVTRMIPELAWVTVADAAVGNGAAQAIAQASGMNLRGGMRPPFE